MRGPPGNSQLPPAESLISVPAGKRDSSPGGSSVASTIQGYNSIPTSSLNNSRIADIMQRATSTLSVTQRQSINTATTMQVASTHSGSAPGGNSTRRIVSSPTFGIAIIPTPLSDLENLPTPIRKPRSPQNHSKSTLNASYQTELATEVVVIATAGGIYVSINGLG